MTTGRITKETLAVLRGLTCYSQGLLKLGDEHLSPPDLSRHDLYNFVVGRSNLDFKKRGQTKLRALGAWVLQLSKQKPFVGPVREWLMILRKDLDNTGVSDPDRIKIGDRLLQSTEGTESELFYRALHPSFKIDHRDTREAAQQFTGLYRLYRYTSRADEPNKVAISILKITPFADGTLEEDTLELRFALYYKKRGAGSDPRLIVGAVIPKLEHLYFLGMDDGSRSSPFFMATKRDFVDGNLLGIMARRSTSSHVMAARILASPMLSKDDRDSMTVQQIDLECKQKFGEIDVVDAVRINGFQEQIGKFIDNSADIEMNKVLGEYME